MLCRCCAIEKPMSMYEKVGNSYRKLCKECRAEQQKRWKSEHKEELADKRRKWVEKNKDYLDAYMIEYRERNKETIRQKNKILFDERKDFYNSQRRAKAKANPEHAAEMMRKSYLKHREKRLLSMQEYGKANPHVIQKRQVKRRTAAKNSVVNWNQEWNDFVAQEAGILRTQRNLTTGIKWEVDHIVPLNGKSVCGLHVAENLAVIPMYLNRSKRHKFNPDKDLKNAFYG